MKQIERPKIDYKLNLGKIKTELRFRSNNMKLNTVDLQRDKERQKGSIKT
jgi:hypothetical protein